MDFLKTLVARSRTFALILSVIPTCYAMPSRSALRRHFQPLFTSGEAAGKALSWRDPDWRAGFPSTIPADCENGDGLDVPARPKGASNPAD